jgi:hypothetical protein
MVGAFEDAEVVGAASYSGAVTVDPDGGSDPVPGALPEPNGGGGLIPGFIDASPLNADEDLHLELAVLTTRGLFVADFETENSQPELRIVRWGTYDSSNKLLASDINHDGLTDIIVTNDAEFEVLLARAHDAERSATR